MKLKQFFTLAVAVLCSSMMLADTQQSSLQADCGSFVTITATPATGYHFVQWSDGNWEETRTVYVSGDSTIEAIFAINHYSIVFKNWDLTTLDSLDWDYLTLPTYSGTPTRPANERFTYTFKGWDHEITPVTGTDTYIAVYDSTAIGYTLTVTGVNGTVTGSGTYAYGEIATITATPYGCYHFANWSNGDMNATTTVVITGNMEINAIFEIDKFTITVKSGDDKQGTVNITQ